MPTWPNASLPQFMNVQGYTENFADGRLRTPMEAGPAKVRRRTTAAARSVSLSADLSVTQKERFRRWYVKDTDMGVTPFEFPNQSLHHRTIIAEGGVPLLDDNGAAIVIANYWLVRFGETAPSLINLSVDLWRVNFTLEILRRKGG